MDRRAFLKAFAATVGAGGVPAVAIARELPSVCIPAGALGPNSVVRVTWVVDEIAAPDGKVIQPAPHFTYVEEPLIHVNLDGHCFSYRQSDPLGTEYMAHGPDGAVSWVERFRA